MSYAHQDKEGRLHHHIDSGSQTDITGDPESVDGIEPDLPVDNGLLQGERKVGEHLLRLQLGIQQEGASFLDSFQHVVSTQIGFVVHGHEIGVQYLVGRIDHGFPKSQVRNGNTAGFLRVVHKMSLGIEFRIVADDLNGVLVGAYRSVGTQAVELALNHIVGKNGNVVRYLQAGVRHVVVDADGKSVFGNIGG